MKIENNPEIAQLIEVAERVLAERSEKRLADHERAILAHVLMGEPLKTAKAGCYRSGTIVKQLAPKLWNRLGEEVRCKNVRLFLENAAERFQAASSTTESQEDDASISPADDNPSPAVDQDSPKRILHNLPPRQYSKFIGRRQEREKLLKLLMPKHPDNKICITGMGGVGKTSLALACAYQCLYASSDPEPTVNIPIFKLIIFVTAKQQVLDRDGLHQRRVHQSTDLLRQIINMLDRNELLINESPATNLEDQIALIYRVLEKYETLLILDNLEAVENRKPITDFLCDLPSTVKSILTTRGEPIGIPIPLPALPEEDGLNLVQHQASHIGVVLSAENRKDLYDLTGGLPLAIHLVIGQLCKGRSIQRIREQLPLPTGELVQYCFKDSVESIQNQPAYWLLLATTLFPESVSRDMLVKVAIPDENLSAAEDEMGRLQMLSLVNQESINEIDTRYRIVAPLRAYLRFQLLDHPEFEQVARKRQLDEYLKLSKKYADQDPGEWQGQFEGLDQEWENILEIAKWAMDNRHYPELLHLWQNLKPYFYMVGRGASRMRFWQPGLEWAEWLTKTALEQQDKQNAGALLFFRAWVQMGMNHPDALSEAGKLLNQAWELRQNQAPKDQANIARQMGWLKVQQRQFDEAHEWLKQSEQILQNVALEQHKYQECLSHTRYYQGWIYLKTGEYDNAKRYFEQAYHYAEEIKSDRLVRLIQTSLAEVAIHRKDFKLAKTLLDEGLRIAKINTDYKYLAEIKHSLVKLAHAEGNTAKKRREAIEAIEIFKQIGMLTKAEEVQILLDTNTSKNGSSEA